MPDWSCPGVRGGRGEQQVGEVMLGRSTVFDVNTGHLAQVEAAVYVLLFLTYRGEFPVLFFWGRGSFVDPISPLCHTPTSISYSLAFRVPQWLDQI